MQAAIGETDRRRAIQLAYNEEHGITAASIVKGISDIAEFLQAEGKTPEGPPALASASGSRPRTMSTQRARADDRRARGGDARGRRGPALRVRRAAARRDPRAAPRPARPCSELEQSASGAGLGAPPPAPCLRRRACSDLVRPRGPRPAVAAHARPVRDPRLRGHAPADAGRARRAALRGVAGALADRRRRWRPRRSPSAGRVGRPGLQPPRAARCGRPARVVAARRLARRTCARCRASGPTPRRRSARSRSGATSCRSTRTSARVAGAHGRWRRADDAAGSSNQAVMELGAHGLPRARGALRRCPVAARLRVGGRGRGRAARGRRGPRASASRTPTAGSAAASSRRWRRARSCPDGIEPERLERAVEGLVRDGSSCAATGLR